MRTLSLFGILLTANFVTAGMGLPLTGDEGKLAVANIMPIVFTAAALVQYAGAGGRIRREVAGLFIFFNLAALCSFFLYLARYAWPPNFVVLLFQNFEFMFCLLLAWYARNNSPEFLRVVRLGIYLSIPATLWYGWHDLSQGAIFSAFGMDDKSHAAVLLCLQAFILVRFFGRASDCITGLALLLLSFLTISRLPIFLAPAILLALMARSRFGVVVGIAFVACAAVLLVMAGDTVLRVFAVLDRLSSIEAIAQSGSTSAHVVLLQTAWQLKFADVWSFLLGIGPNNFSKALISSSTATAAMQAVDPNLVTFARAGRAPLHSTSMQILLDYNLLLFLLFVWMVLWISRFLWRSRKLAELVLLTGMFGASLFYSLHNKPYFFLYAGTICLLVAARSELCSPKQPTGELLETSSAIA